MCTNSGCNKNLKDLEERVWKTKKIRMEAEERRIGLQNQFSLVLNGATVLALLISVVALLPHQMISNNGMAIFSITISIGVMVTSLVITGYNFTEKANQFRRSYLNLDALENEIRNEIDDENCDKEKTISLERQYNQIQAATLNHNNIDYIYFKVSQLRNVKLSEEKEVYKLVNWERFEFFCSKFILPIIFFVIMCFIIWITIGTIIEG